MRLTNSIYFTKMNSWDKYLILHISALSWIPLVLYFIFDKLFDNFGITLLGILGVLVPLWLYCIRGMGKIEYENYRKKIERDSKGNHKIYKGVESEEC